MNKYLVGCLGVSFVVGISLLGAVAFFLLSEFPVLDASLSVPPEASLGATITMVVTTTNTHTKAIKLDSIDVGDTFLEGFRVLSVDPEPSDTMRVFGMRTWFFGERVEPGDSLDVRFALEAVMEGHFSGDVDVCNPTQDFTTLIADVVIREEEGATAAEEQGL